MGKINNVNRRSVSIANAEFASLTQPSADANLPLAAATRINANDKQSFGYNPKNGLGPVTVSIELFNPTQSAAGGEDRINGRSKRAHSM
ncbi:hypothetical protein Trydic_g2296 [Trypoxylus dichotomus]